MTFNAVGALRRVESTGLDYVSGPSSALVREVPAVRQVRPVRHIRQVRPCRGFTLIELMVVLFVAGLISAFVVPSFLGGLRGIRLKGEVKHLAATLRYARSRAVCSKGLAVVKLDLSEGTYELTIRKRSRESRGSSAGGLGVFGGGLGSGTGLQSPGGLNSGSLSSSRSFGRSSGLGASSGLGEPAEGLEREGGQSESPLAQAAQKKRRLPEGVKIASFTYQEEKFEDGVCNVFFFPTGTSTGGSIELLSESGRSFVIEIEAVTGSVKIRTPEDY